MTEITEKQTANEETINNVETKTELSVDEKALKALNEACANYGLEPCNIAKVMSDKIKEQCNLMKNEANMYRQELDKTKAKVVNNHKSFVLLFVLINVLIVEKPSK